MMSGALAPAACARFKGVVLSADAFEDPDGADCDVAGAFDEAYVPQEPRSLRG